MYCSQFEPYSHQKQIWHIQEIKLNYGASEKRQKSFIIVINERGDIMAKTTVRQLLASKGHDAWSVSPDTTVFDALKVLADKDIGAVVVLTGGELCGVLSERDYARKVVLEGKASMTTPVSEIMTSPVLVVTPDQTIDKCMALMTDKHLRHLPVVENDQVVGMVSIGDVVKTVIADQEFMLDQLETYITGPTLNG
jgi:CBS domain-containing protein